MVGNRDDLDLLIHRIVNQGVWKTSHNKAASTVSPSVAQRRVVEKEAYRVFELGDKCQRELIARALLIEFSRLPKIHYRIGCRR